MFAAWFKKKPPPSLTDQLAALAACGIQLSPDATAERLLSVRSEQEYVSHPYELLLVALGGDHRLAANVWHFDTECIEDHGDYARIARRMSEMAGDDLVLTNIEDFVDVEAGEARLSFELDGEAYAWECEVDDDWVDSSVLSDVASLVASKNRRRRFVILGLAQDCILGCLDHDQLSTLRRVTGLAFELLT